ncbi:nucleotidyltransferase family protein [Desulfobulbus alkaliphilus]|uniref:nucleotidyltransferase family protein n=1 Tax=Desulfobulbus alkaliphilus TaxID=869814 RepID=UPI001966C205|nr:nucleotidyltransferase family protein [Desulfobulbus alkaliphilus]MBM9537997.1 nucleotidyltransferase family protein [Desulfobulbus alkaliphilus]
MIRTILGLCARDRGNESMYVLLGQHLHELSRRQTSWEPLVHSAEHHGLAPLLYKHLKQLAIGIPLHPRRQLQSLTLRSRHANAIRNIATAEIARALAEERINLVLAKGIALCNLVYSEPGLRPMRDIDLLVADADTARTAALLADLGYRSEERHDIPDDYYHLVPMTRSIDGMTITVEVHRNLLPYHRQYPPWPLARSLDNGWDFSIDDVPVRTLALEDMLFHVALHGLQAPLTYEPFRFIHVADVVSLVENHLEEIDWQVVQTLFPAGINLLTCLHWLTPWSESVFMKLGLEPGRRPWGVGQPYSGWPLHRFRNVRFRQVPEFARNTLLPSLWWLRLYYGRGPGRPSMRARWIDHPRLLLQWLKAYALHYIRGKRWA